MASFDGRALLAIGSEHGEGGARARGLAVEEDDEIVQEADRDLVAVLQAVDHEDDRFPEVPQSASTLRTLKNTRDRAPRTHELKYPE